MFEDSTFESTGSIHTRSRNWMFATFGLNIAVLLALVLIPLCYPGALPRLALATLMEIPKAQTETPKPAAREQSAHTATSQIEDGRVIVPTRIPKMPWIADEHEDDMPPMNAANLADVSNDPFGTGVLRGSGTHPNIVRAQTGPKAISTGVAAGLLIHQVMPHYPQIAQSMRLQGTVVLQATISKSGAIENLRVVSGPALLQQAALDAVKQWQYRPYLLNGEPVEVETAVNVDFKLQ